MKRLSAILLVGALVFGTVGCTNMNKTQQGLLSGAAGGAILGAGLGVTIEITLFSPIGDSSI